MNIIINFSKLYFQYRSVLEHKSKHLEHRLEAEFTNTNFYFILDSHNEIENISLNPEDSLLITFDSDKNWSETKIANYSKKGINSRNINFSEIYQIIKSEIFI